jgi:hypothetical protein
MVNDVLVSAIATVAIACSGHAANRPLRNETASDPGNENRCAMIDAALRIEEPSYQRFYRYSCGDENEPVTSTSLIQAVFDGEEVPTRCASRSFEVLRRDECRYSHRGRAVILRFRLEKEREWSFTASELMCSHVVDIDYYCHAIGGYVVRQHGRWRAFQDLERFLEAGRAREDAAR